MEKKYQLIVIKSGKEKRIPVFIMQSAVRDFIDCMDWTDEQFKENTMEVIESKSSADTSKSKGCGKEFYEDDLPFGSNVICGSKMNGWLNRNKINLCPSCKKSKVKEMKI